MTGFNLNRGMTENEFWTELYRVGISGETTQEIKLFKEPEKSHQQIDEMPLHNIVMCDKKYAVLRKAYTYVDDFGSIFESWTYYFCGINDEHKYFIRPLKNFPLNQFSKPHPTIEDVANWVNRVDEDFDTRVQGDVLAKFVNIDDTNLDNTSKQKRTIDVSDRALAFAPQTTPQLGIGTPFSFAQHRPQVRRALFEGLIRPSRESSGENVIEVEGKKYSEITDSPLKLGNHKLFTEGKIYASKEVPFICVIGNSLILQHHEHEVKEMVIPDKCVVILAAQRGRDFDLKDLNYLRKAYD